MAAFLGVDRKTRQGQILGSVCDALSQAIAGLRRQQAIMASMNEASPDLIQMEYGVGSGSSLKDATDALVLKFDFSAIENFIAQVG